MAPLEYEDVFLSFSPYGHEYQRFEHVKVRLLDDDGVEIANDTPRAKKHSRYSCEDMDNDEIGVSGGQKT